MTKPADPFTEALNFVLNKEGGYSDDKQDPGGKTRYGVTESVAREHGYKGEMKDFPMSKAKEIYRVAYWGKINGDKLPWPLSLFVFDCAVNQGARTASILMQKALGVTADGAIGSATIAAAAKSSEWHAAKFMALRADLYTRTNHYDRFGAGWLTRLFEAAMHA